MKYKIEQNALLIIQYFIIIVSSLSYETITQFYYLEDLCISNSRINDVQPEQTLQLHVKFESSSRSSLKWYQKSKRKCYKEFKTHDRASHFLVTISNVTIPSCSDICECNYLQVSEIGYENKYCGVNTEKIYFESKSNSLTLTFHHSINMEFELSIAFTVERNFYIIPGMPNNQHLLSGQIIESPYFPAEYLSGYSAEYIIQCSEPNCHVVLIFLDFEMSQESYIEIQGHNGSHPEQFSGAVLRPPAVISQHNELVMKFQANRHPGGPGFRAICMFQKGEAKKPNIDCGGSFEGHSGSVSIATPRREELYDCIWRVQPPLFPYAKPYILSVSFISLRNIAPQSVLEFREGLYSSSRLVKSISCNDSNCNQNLAEVTASATHGFYIHFIGFLNEQSEMTMTYSIYHERYCTENEFTCTNGRCLISKLRCDGINNCLDARDEKQCPVTIIPTVQLPTQPYMTKEKLTSPISFRIFLGFLIIGICGVILIFVVVIYAFVRHFVPRIPQNTQEMLDIQSENQGPPPRYTESSNPENDCPPSYDEFIKLSDCYPPLLYMRAMHKAPSIRPRAYSTTNFDHRPSSQRSLKRKSVDTVLYRTADPPKPGCSFEDHSWKSYKRRRSIDDSFLASSKRRCPPPGDLWISIHYGERNLCSTRSLIVTCSTDFPEALKTRCCSDPCTSMNKVHHPL